MPLTGALVCVCYTTHTSPPPPSPFTLRTLTPLSPFTLPQVSVGSSGLDVGAGVTLSALEEVLKQQVASQPKHKTRGFAAAAEQLRWFAGE